MKENLGLSERIYKCEECRIEINRDLNAAINLENYNNTVSYTGRLEKESEACGVSRTTKSRKAEGHNEAGSQQQI